MAAKDLILELGSEELPSGFIPAALAGLESALKKTLEENRLEWGGVATLGTPRRLAVVVRGLETRQRDATVTAKGPNLKAAYDGDGNPTKALLGFARSQGLRPEDLKKVETDRGAYVQAVKRVRGGKTADILPGLLRGVISSLAFPKTMRWGTHEMSFARPLHWILSLYGTKPVEFDCGHLKSGRLTRGHRFLDSKKKRAGIRVKDADDYLKKLREHHVIADPSERKGIITRGLEKEAAEAEGGILPDPELLDEVTNLVEYPVVIRGSFDRGFLDLPPEVVINAMREHQRYFSVVGRDGALMPCFVTVAGTPVEDASVVRAGNERVLRARLNDARFYFENDVKTPLAEFAERLRGVVFQSRLGTSYEKVERFARLALFIGSELNFSAPLGENEVPGDFLKADHDPKMLDRKTVTPLIRNKFVLGRAAMLCKADLVSGMVGEFPRLQGIMGREYARRAGEDRDVCEAIYEHYMPVSAAGELPATDAGAIIGIADRLDTIVGCFGVGLVPTGAADPYALRRAALGIIRIILDRNFSISLDTLTDRALANLAGKLARPAKEVKAGVRAFFCERLRNQLLGEGLSFDAIDAVLSTDWFDVRDSVKRIRALEGFKKHPACGSLVIAFKRVANILKGEEERLVTRTPDRGLFRDPAEKALYETSCGIAPDIENYRREGDYEKAFSTLASIKDIIDRFFDDVMVMAEDEGLRTNRLQLLCAVKALYYRIADLSKLVV